MKKQILGRMIGIGMVVVSILLLPHCDGDATYMMLTIPLGLYITFAPKDVFDF